MDANKKGKISKKFGFTLMETLIGVSVLVVVSMSVYQAFGLLTKTARISRNRVMAAAVANEQIEILRNLPYASVGTVGGLPSGLIVPERTIEKEGEKFTVLTTVRNIDDAFDGTLGGSPNDISPADYKKAEVSVTCPGCQTVKLTTVIAPKNLEITSNNGALFVNVFDALGQPISGADVSIENSYVNPDVDIEDVSGTNGSLQLVDVPLSTQKYAIAVSKDGYSSERTYPPGGSGNPNPIKPDATVARRQVTQVSFSIDKLSSLNVSTRNSMCSSTPNIGFTLTGAKLIGTSLPKYSASLTTDAEGNKEITGLEWDSYSATIPSASTHYLIGTLPMSPFSLLPDSEQNLILVTKPKNPNGLLISIKDVGSHLPITGATVTVTGVGTLTTGRGSQTQTDWSHGAGQTDISDLAKYFASDDISINNPTGQLKLASTLGVYEPSGYLESSTFDTGSASNFYNLTWSPVDQPSQAGAGSVKFQLAANDDNATWDFTGPDGTGGTYYTTPGSSISATLNGKRYFRYRVYLATVKTSVTPSISDVTFTFTSLCVPSGQVFFDGLSTGYYRVSVTKDGYRSVTNTGVTVSSGWQEKIINLTPR